MEQNKQQYETIFIVNASLDDPQIEVIIAKVQEQITRYGGEIISTDRWGRKRLTYPIKKKNNGFYTLIEFKAPGSSIQQLEKFYKLDENIMRYLSIKLDKKALKAKELRASKLAEPEEFVVPFEADLKEPLFEDESETPVIDK
jgi:small subunit ribosomal protein S6